MDITPLIPEGRQIIQAYSAAGFKVSGISYTDPIIVSPQGTKLWGARSYKDLTEQDFDDVAQSSGDIDVLLLGTGSRGEFFPPALRQSLKSKGLTVETMDTGAACRTYNVLMAEGRRVVAALLPL